MRSAGFDNDGFEEWNNFHGAWASGDPVTLPASDAGRTQISRGSFALDLDGFDQKLTYASRSPFGGGARRRSSFNSFLDINRNSTKSTSTFLSSGDSAFDDALDVFLKKKGKIIESPTPSQRENRSMEDQSAVNRTKRKKVSGLRRCKTSDCATSTLATKENLRRKLKRAISGEIAPVQVESENARSRSPAPKSLVKTEDESTKSSRQSREGKNRFSKSLGSILIDDHSRSGGSVGSNSTKGVANNVRHNRKPLKSPTKGRLKRTESERGQTSPPSSKAEAFRKAALEEQGGHLGPVAKGIANILNREDLERARPKLTETPGSIGTKCRSRTRENQSTRSGDSPQTPESGRSRSPKRSHTHSSSSRSPCRPSDNTRTCPPRSERDRSRSSSRSPKNKAAVAAAGASLLGNKSEHILDDDMESLFDDSSSKVSRISPRNKPDRYKNTVDSATMADGSARSREKGARPNGERAPLRTGKGENTSPNRRGRPTGRSTGALEALPRGRREGLEAPRWRRTGSVEVTQSRRTGSVQAPRHRGETVSASRLRRTNSVDTRNRLRERQQQQVVASILGPPSFDDEPDPLPPAPPVNLPSICGLAGGDVQAWKAGNKKSQPRDKDAGRPQQKDANVGRRFTQAFWGEKIKKAKNAKPALK